MSRIDDLIAEHCPDGVEFRALGTLGKRNKGTPITAAKMKVLREIPGPIRVFAGGRTIADVSETAIPAKDVVRVPSIIVKSRGNVGFTFYEKPFTHKSELWSYSIDDPTVNQKFVYYYLLTRVTWLQELARATSVKLPQLGVRDTDTLRVPVPPLEVQREIVRILDQFTALEAELEAELETRRRQYERYRRDLFQFGDDRPADHLALREFCDFKRGTAITAKATRPGVVPVVANGPKSMYFHDESNRDGGTVVVARSGAYAGLVSFWEGPIFLTDAFSVHPRSGVATSRYVFHLLQVQQIDLHDLKRGAGVPHVRVKEFEERIVSLPPLEEQERITALLDKFDALVNDLSVGLPAELAARRKQYEYYRDKLLTFEEAV